MLRKILTILLLSAGWAPAQSTLHVAAAISLREVLQPIASAYEADSNTRIEFTFGASGQLAAQIRNGADVDLFISAANTQVDELAAAGLVVDGSRHVIGGNKLVLVVPKIAKDPPRNLMALADDRFRRVAIGEPRSVPAGQYAMQALTRLGLVDRVRDKLVYGTNVRQVLTYVEQGEVVAGLVYATDAAESGDKVRVVEPVPADAHDPIVYPAVIIKSSKQQPAAGAFLTYLQSDNSRRVLSDKGFSPATSPTTTTAP
jgi:molybdate transport system substrate-binding protein